MSIRDKQKDHLKGGSGEGGRGRQIEWGGGEGQHPILEGAIRDRCCRQIRRTKIPNKILASSLGTVKSETYVNVSL